MKRIVDGEMEEYYLCGHCARELGYENALDSLGLNLGSFLGNFLGASSSYPTGLAGVERCERCGSSFSDIVSSGRVGCAHCYEKFYEKLMPSIQNIHGKTKHAGKISHACGNKAQKARELASLKAKMKTAIQTQNFEQAAQLRDQIKALESEGGQHE